ncbi:MAG: VTT domain-containing protein [Kiritimatiellae bacterium]|nr:VTT domain-containing protein [Kiritimatiellia bacterium]
MTVMFEQKPLIRSRPFLKAGAALVVVAAGMWIIYSSPLVDYFQNLALFRQRLNDFGWMAPLVFVGLSALLASVGFSRLLLSAAAGVLFGFYRGLLYALAGTLFGAYAMFLIARWIGRDAILRRWPRVGEVGHLFEKFSIPAIFALRQAPVSGLLINPALAVMPVKHGAFLIGTLLGFLPGAVPCVLAGSGAMHESHAAGYGLIAAAMLMLGGVWYFSALYIRKFRMAAKREDR